MQIVENTSSWRGGYSVYIDVCEGILEVSHNVYYTTLS